MVKNFLILLVVFVALFIFLVTFVNNPDISLNRIETLEANLAKESYQLFVLPCPSTPVSMFLSIDDLKKYGLYGKDAENYLLIDKEGVVQLNGEKIAEVNSELHLYLENNRYNIFIDGKKLVVDSSGLKFYLLTQLPSFPKALFKNYREVCMADSFMRKDIFADSNWILSSGKWEMNQHGAGATETKDALYKDGVARTVNPFSVQGSDNGILSYGEKNLSGYSVEGRFYFGVPQMGKVRDIRSLPDSFALAQGCIGGNQVKFGWDKGKERFVLYFRKSGDEWLVVKEWKNLRPPISNWVKLKIKVEGGSLVKAFIDDVEVLQYNTKMFISGPFHVICGKDVVEFDDIKAGIVDSTLENEGDLLFIQSSAHSKKNLKTQDGLEFQKWAKGVEIFLTRKRGTFYTLISNNAITGDIYYESIPYSYEKGNLGNGLYQYGFYKGSALKSDITKVNNLLFSINLKREKMKWYVEDVRYPKINGKELGLELRISRLAENENRPAIFIDGSWVPLGEPVKGFIHFSVGSKRPYIHQEHHQIKCTNLVNDMFEKAPTEWNWVQGRFRMAERWACSDQWNFMACGGTGVPWMASKKIFTGDQAHEYFISVRPVKPTDGGDDRFYYNPKEDRGLKVFKEHSGWYNTHDLNFAFCSDGVNPLSGYAVIYAGCGNSKNYLLRDGVIIAENKLQLIPGGSYRNIHWKWWNFRVAKDGKNIEVFLGGKLLFKFIDENPLQGGHVGFFTVRNGFSVAKINSIADKIEDDPHFMYLKTTSIDSNWVPLIKDSVDLEKAEKPFDISVKQFLGGGSMAIRYSLRYIDLQKYPILDLPLDLDDGTSVNMFLYILNKSYVIRLDNSSLDKTKALLTSEFERGEMFQLKYKDIGDENSPYFLGQIDASANLKVDILALLKAKGVKAPYRLQSITIGNSSESGFLTFGANKNRRGAVYKVGTPKLLEASNE